MKKLFSLLTILAVLASPALCACGESKPNTDPSAENTTSDIPAAVEAEENAPAPEETAYDPGIEQKDYAGRTFTIMDRSPDSSGWWISMDVYSEELNGEPLNDAVFNRNETVNAYFNVKITPFTIPDGNFLATLRNSASAGDHIADLAMLTLATSITSAKSSLLFDLNGFDAFHRDAPYYTGSILDDTSILGRNYLAVGDMTLVANEGTWSMMYNKQVAENYEITGLYDMVREGKWTADQFYALTKDIGTDLDGNGTTDLNDFFGMLTTGDAYTGFLYALDYRVLDKDENDAYVFCGFTERLATAAEKINMILNDDRITCHGQLGGDWSVFQKMFEANQSLFYSEVLQCVTRLRNMDVDFGVLPLPKLDEVQSAYHTNIHSWASDALTIPTVAEDPEMSAGVFEYLSFASMSTLKPAYYEKVLTYKAMRDEDSVEMLDYLLDGRVVDIGYLDNTGTIYSGLVSQISSGKIEIASFFQKWEKPAKKQLEKFMSSFTE